MSRPPKILLLGSAGEDSVPSVTAEGLFARQLEQSGSKDSRQ